MISVFDMFSVGIGPSSSHTVGPMRAGAEFAAELSADQSISSITAVTVELYGSLGQTGKGHGTGKAVILGLLGEMPESVDVDTIDSRLADIEKTQFLLLNGEQRVRFPNKNAIVFHRRKTLPKHANALTFFAYDSTDNLVKSQTYYSIGGGFIIKDEDFDAAKTLAMTTQATVPYPFKTAAQLCEQCNTNGLRISSLMLKNESVLRPAKEVKSKLFDIWLTMKACIERGIDNEGILPGGLKVVRRAPGLYRRLQSERSADPMQTMDWVNLFALAVNEENAAGGRVVTAPTNGAAGIIPAVMAYFDKFIRPMDEETAARFLLTAGAIGTRRFLVQR